MKERFTIELSGKANRMLEDIKNDPDMDFRTKAEIIRRSLYVYSYISKKVNTEGFKIHAVSDDKESLDLTNLFEV